MENLLRSELFCAANSAKRRPEVPGLRGLVGPRLCDLWPGRNERSSSEGRRHRRLRRSDRGGQEITSRVPLTPAEGRTLNTRVSVQVDEAPLRKRHQQGWVMEVTSDMERCIARIR